jgi:D-lactate dehydrogenase
MEKIKIAFFDTKPYDMEVFKALNESYGFEIRFYKNHLNEENSVLANGFDVVCVFVNDSLNKQMIEILNGYGVKLIALRCAGFNNVDLNAAHGKIRVVRVPAYSPHAIAEYTVALILTLNRKIHRAYYRTRDLNFALSGLMGFDLNGKTAGIIGTGKIGKVLVQILKGFGMEVLLFDKYPDEQFAKDMGVGYVDLDTVFKTSDIVSLNCPLTKETEYMINAKTIKMMKKGVMLINTGRGKLINTKDLIEGLKDGKIGSAGLDVYEEEGNYFYEDHSDRLLPDDVLARLLTFNNVIITSHQGFFTREALNNIATTTLDNIKEFYGYPYKSKLTNEVCHKCQ